SQQVGSGRAVARVALDVEPGNQRGGAMAFVTCSVVRTERMIRHCSRFEQHYLPSPCAASKGLGWRMQFAGCSARISPLCFPHMTVFHELSGSCTKMASALVPRNGRPDPCAQS